ncbi:MAG: HAMP domain-containing sensor histidine kinase [Actinomycetaceae bacterium]|nr:HAMP domain-containing sensor histidine kinase [Actinomycetaceae bacterium]
MINVFLLIVVTAALGAVIVFVLRSYLLSTLDDEIKASRDVIKKELNTVIARNPDPTVGNQNKPYGEDPLSSYYIYIDLEQEYADRYDLTQKERIPPELREKFGTPADPEGVIDSNNSAEPVTVPGAKSGDSQWRAVVLLVDQADRSTGTTTPIGKVVIARPLAPMYATITTVIQRVVIAGLGIIMLGSMLAYVFVRRSLRPLQGIEHATHAIAKGDLSRRVPSGKEGSEVGMLADSINIMLAQIEQAFDAKQRSESKMRQFVSDASHELRTPLATVRGYAELYRIGGVASGEVPQTMERIESEAHRMSGLVEDLLQLARLDEGRPLSFEPVSMTELCVNAVMDFRVRADDRSAVVIGLDGSEAPEIGITADADKVTQVVTNLLSNVLTHTPAGTPVEVAVGVDGAQAIIEVRDHGQGVDKKDTEHLFERFYRADYSRSRASGGSGLGLAIVASVMGAHGGTARLSETPGGGLTVRLAFPLSKQEVAKNSAPRSEQDGESAQTAEPTGANRPSSGENRTGGSADVAAEASPSNAAPGKDKKDKKPRRDKKGR